MWPQTQQFDSICFLDDQAQNAAVLGKCADFDKFADGNTDFYPAFGNNEGRLQWLRRLQDAGCSVPVIVHPDAYVSPTACLSQGVVILPKAVVNTGCQIGEGCIVNCGAIVDHDCILEPGVHICLGAIIKAENRIPQKMKIEAGQIILNRTYPLV